MANDASSDLSSIARGIWWFVLLRGIFAIIFGLVAVIAPVVALIGITIIFGIYAIIDGLVEIVQAIRLRRSLAYWGWLLVQGIVSLIAGVLALFSPQIFGTVGGLFILWIIAIYALVNGVVGLASGIGSESSSAKTWGIVSSVISILFAIILGIALVVSPSAAVTSFVWVVGIYGIVFGIALLVAAFQIRSAAKELVF